MQCNMLTQKCISVPRERITRTPHPLEWGYRHVRIVEGHIIE